MSRWRSSGFGACLAGIVLFMGIACDRGSNNTATKEQVSEESKAATQNLDATKDSGFMLDAYSYGLMIVQYSELAAEKSQRKAVVSFAEQSASWHKALNQEIKNFADQQRISLPEVAGDDVHTYTEELNALPPDQLDARYLQVLQEIQKKMIGRYERAAEGAGSEELRSWATQKLSDLQAHAQAVQELSTQVGS